MKAGSNSQVSLSIPDYQVIIDLIKGSTKFMLLCDNNTFHHCSKLFLEKIAVKPDVIHSIEIGELNKNLELVEQVYDDLLENGFDRHSIVVNLGGGVVCDLGGFAASTFKRGISFINVPTTLLAMVDAAHGGKVGVNYKGIKNQIGSFQEATSVLIDPIYLNTLDEEHIYSGFAEMIKHTLIADKHQWDLLKKIKHLSVENLDIELIKSSIVIKRMIVDSDPLEKADRKKLNFGHSIGHAIESHFTNKGEEISHGRAIAAGMNCEVRLSKSAGIIESEVNEIIQYLDSIYGKLKISEKDIDSLVNFMQFDKKNKEGKLNFTLLESTGSSIFDQYIDENEVRKTLMEYINGR